MVKLKIDNTEYEAPEGLTILDVARGAGLNIPTLCHKDGLTPLFFMYGLYGKG